MTGIAKLKIIKAVCWVGAFVDALWAAALVTPSLYKILICRPDLVPDLTFRLTMGVGASLMAGWTVLLVWCAASPVERRAVMLFTVFPIIAGLFVVTTIGVINANTSTIWLLGKLLVLCAGMITAYKLASGMARENTHEIHN